MNLVRHLKRNKLPKLERIVLKLIRRYRIRQRTCRLTIRTEPVLETVGDEVIN